MQSAPLQSGVTSPLARRIAEGKLKDPLFATYEKLLPIVASLDEAQARWGVKGSIAEIGVHRGAFFLPLAMCRRDGELAVAIDIFDRQELNWNPAGGAALQAPFRKAVETHLGSGQGVELITGDSLYISPTEVLASTGGVRVRLFSIDGSHSVHHTVSDIHLAAACVTPGAVVFLDDVKNWGWPGAIEGFARYMLLSDHHRLVPFWLLGNKLLMTTPSHHAQYLNVAEELAQRDGRKANVSYRVSRFFGHDVVGY
jgi:hypothetical protein